jgi:hypothetical protein
LTSSSGGSNESALISAATASFIAADALSAPGRTRAQFVNVSH